MAKASSWRVGDGTGPEGAAGAGQLFLWMNYHAKRLECVQLAGAVVRQDSFKSGSKLHALQTLRAVRLRLCRTASLADWRRSTTPSLHHPLLGHHDFHRLVALVRGVFFRVNVRRGCRRFQRSRRLAGGRLVGLLLRYLFGSPRLTRASRRNALQVLIARSPSARVHTPPG